MTRLNASHGIAGPGLATLVAVAAGLALAACASQPQPDDAAPASSTAPATSSAAPDSPSPSPAPAPAPAPTATAAASAGTGGLPAGMLGTPSLEDQPLTHFDHPDLVPVAVRAASHPGYDRVVFEFSGTGRPGWYTEYTDQPGQLASGHPLPFDGAIALVIGIEGTPAPYTPELQERYIDLGTYPGAGAVTSVNYAATFEAQSQFVIGLTDKRPYSVTFLEGPPRVVVDFLDA